MGRDYDNCVRTTITLPDPLLRNVKRTASARGVTLSAFIEDAVRAQTGARQATRSSCTPCGESWFSRIWILIARLRWLLLTLSWRSGKVIR